jgi:GNAT superfamily N-acetyltransferase
MTDSGTSSTPSTSELVALGAPVALRDGSRVRLRQGQSQDRELLVRGFARLSDESRYRRFLVAMPELSEAMVRYLTEIDHHDHEAIIALDEETGEGIGVARYVRDSERPDVAEVAVTVIDDWQQRGLGTLLLEVLAARARKEGVKSFTALMLASNQEMMEVLEHLGPVRVLDRDLGTVEIEIPIPEVDVAPVLRKLLRIAALTPPPSYGAEPAPPADTAARESSTDGADRGARHPKIRRPRARSRSGRQGREPRE